MICGGGWNGGKLKGKNKRRGRLIGKKNVGKAKKRDKESQEEVQEV